MLDERPTAPPLLPPEVPVLVGDVELDGLLLVREDRWDATLEALDWTEDKLWVMEEAMEDAGRTKSARKIQKRK